MMSSFLILLHLCTLQIMVSSLPACWLPGHVVLKAHNLLRDMGSPFPVDCLPFNANMTFPHVDWTHPSVHQCRLVSSLVYHSLEGAEKVFTNATPGFDTWDIQKFHEFQTTKHRLMEAGKCLSGVFSSRVLDSYFVNVTMNLQQPESTHCGWSALRRDLHKVLNAALHHHPSCFKQ